MNAYASLTDQELDLLSLKIYRAATRLFDTASALFAEMSQSASWTPDYDGMSARARLLMAAGREQNELHSETVAEIRARRERASAARLQLQILAEWDQDAAMLREAQLNEEGK